MYLLYSCHKPTLFLSYTYSMLVISQLYYVHIPDDIPLALVFFSAFEDLCLQMTGTMESNWVRKLYEPSPIPLYVGRVEDLLGRVPLILYEINTWLWALGAPNLALVVYLWPKTNGSARRPGLRQLREPGRRNRHDSPHESVQLEHKERYILGIYQVYTRQWAF